MRKLWLLVIVATLAILATARADDDCAPLGSPDVAIADRYVEIDPCQPHCVATLVVYEESNGIPGLTRADAWQDDTQGGRCIPDTLVFGFSHAL